MKLNFYKNIHLVIPALGSLALLSLEFPIWFLLMTLSVLIWRYLGEKEYLALPKPWMTNILSVLLFFVVLATYKTIFDREASTLFFSGLCALKILEYKTSRDHLFVVLLLILLISSKFLFSIDIWILPLAAWMSYHLWLSLISFRSPQKKLPKIFKIYFIKIAVISLPLTFALYFMFPRVNSYLMKSNLASGGSAVSGFGNEIRPGSISQLAQSQELIFRAELLDGFYVERQQLYWRGLVLKATDGFRWIQGPTATDLVVGSSQPTSKNTVKNTFQYKITMEPSTQKWLFPLDRPLQMNGNIPVLQTREGLYQASVGLDSRIILRGESDLNLILSPKREDDYLKIPSPSPRVAELVKGFKEKSHNRHEIVENIKKYFVDKNFSYTLNPGEMDEQSIDDFLFRARKGYCEHFASSFAVLARAAGVPARVVIGYQGGELNSLGNFYTIRAQDAHAWDEYVNDQGEWVRLDLVDLVAPARTELGTAEYLKLPENLRSFNIRKKSLEESFIFLAYDYLTTYIDSLNFYWTQWLLDFNLDTQGELLKTLPLSFSIILFFIVIGIFVIFMVLHFWRFWNDPRNLVQFFYKRLLRWAIYQGFPKEPWEGPFSFAERLKIVWPTQSGNFDVIVQTYVSFTYAERTVSINQIAQMTRSLYQLESSTRLRFKMRVI